MPDRGRRRLGLAGPPQPPPPPQEQDSKQNLQREQKQTLQRETTQTRWKEFQAAFQRPQEFLPASQPRQERDDAHLRRSDVDEVVDGLPSEHAASLCPSPALTSTTIPTAQPVAMGSTSTTRDEGERHNLDHHTLLPAPVQSALQPPNHAKAVSAANTTDTDATSKASLASRPNRARGIFKVSSFLNLRSSNFGQIGNSSHGSSTKSKKGSESDARTTTPLESPMEAPATSPWLDFGRRGGARAGSRNSANDKDGEEKSGYFDSATPATIPSLLLSASATTPHDWKEWDQNHNDRTSFLVNAADFTWHRPSFRQIIESLQVAVVSGETVSCSCPGSHGAFEPAGRKLSASQLVLSGAPMSSRAKRRPPMPTPPSPVPAGPGNPIPGRYRSHIMCAIEGIHDMQAALDNANRRAAEAEESRVRDLVQFADLSEEWAERERQYELEIGQLKDAIAATVSSPQPARHRRMFPSLRSEERPGQTDPNRLSKAGLGKAGKEVDSDTCAQDTFLHRVRAAIEASSRTTETKPVEEATVRTVDKGEAKPALICDLDHDKIMSDRLFWDLSVAERNKCRQRRRYAAGHQPMEQPAAVPESTAEWGAALAKKQKKARKGEEDETSHSKRVASEKPRESKAAGRGSRNSDSKRAGRSMSVKRGASNTNVNTNTKDTADDPSFDASPRQPASSRPLGVSQQETKLVRWSTSQPFSPPGSEDDNSGDEDEGSDAGEYSSSDPPSREDGRRQSTVTAVDAKHASDCTAICVAPGVSS